MEKTLNNNQVIVAGEIASDFTFSHEIFGEGFVREISVLDDEEGEAENKPNQIYLDGYICKEPVYRMTPLGREIADILLAVNRAYGKSDYIPCICWGRNARFAGKLKVGEHVAVWGRIQSREYQKRIGNDQIISKTAYEVSVSKMECLE